jgi:hypothetical protein
VNAVANARARINFQDAINGMLDAIRHAANPELSEWAPYVGNRINVAVWWAKHVMRMARRFGYPTTAQLEADTNREGGYPFDYEPPDADGNDATAEERAAESRDQMAATCW